MNSSTLVPLLSIEPISFTTTTVYIPSSNFLKSFIMSVSLLVPVILSDSSISSLLNLQTKSIGSVPATLTFNEIVSPSDFLTDFGSSVIIGASFNLILIFTVSLLMSISSPNSPKGSFKSATLFPFTSINENTL